MVRYHINEARVTDSRESYWNRLFNSYASSYTEEHSISGWSEQGLAVRRMRYEQLLPLLAIDKDALLLDLGCGTGVYSRFLRAAGHNVISMDYAYNVLCIARDKDTSAKKDFVCGDINSLPFKDGSFKHVVCIGVLQSLSEPERPLAEVNRVLAQGATMVLMTLNSLQLKALVGRLLGTTERILVNGRAMPRLATYNPLRFKRYLRDSGFDVIRLSPVQILPPLTGLVKPFLSFIGSIPYLAYASSVDFVVVAKKYRVIVDAR